MNKSQIQAELRRSACEDIDPWLECGFEAFGVAANKARETGKIMDLFELSKDDQRTFFLFVAEAL